MGARVTALDAAKESIAAAKIEAQKLKSKADLPYQLFPFLLDRK